MKTFLGEMDSKKYYLIMVGYFDKSGKYIYAPLAANDYSIREEEYIGTVQSMNDPNIFVMDTYEAAEMRADLFFMSFRKIKEMEVWEAARYEQEGGKVLWEETTRLTTFKRK